MPENKNRTSPWLIAGRVIFTFALIGCIVFIFSNSMQVAAVSEGASGRVLAWMQKILRLLGLNGAANHLTMHIRRVLRHVSWPILGGLLTALTDETIQLFVPGRSSQVTDVWIDFGGVMTGLLAGLILLGLIRMCILLYKHRNED